jgi:hypothetical protein
LVVGRAETSEMEERKAAAKLFILAVNMAD